MLFLLGRNRPFCKQRTLGTHVKNAPVGAFVILLEKLVVIRSQSATSLAARPRFRLERAPTLIGQMADRGGRHWRDFNLQILPIPQRNPTDRSGWLI